MSGVYSEVNIVNIEGRIELIGDACLSNDYSGHDSQFSDNAWLRKLRSYHDDEIGMRTVVNIPLAGKAANVDDESY